MYNAYALMVMTGCYMTTRFVICIVGSWWEGFSSPGGLPLLGLCAILCGSVFLQTVHCSLARYYLVQCSHGMCVHALCLQSIVMFHSLGMKPKRKHFFDKERLAAVLKQKGSPLPTASRSAPDMDTGFWLPKRYPDLNTPLQSIPMQCTNIGCVLETIWKALWGKL